MKNLIYFCLILCFLSLECMTETSVDNKHSMLKHIRKLKKFNLMMKNITNKLINIKNKGFWEKSRLLNSISDKITGMNSAVMGNIKAGSNHFNEEINKNESTTKKLENNSKKGSLNKNVEKLKHAVKKEKSVKKSNKNHIEVKFHNHKNQKGVKINIPNRISKHTEKFQKGIPKPNLNKKYAKLRKSPFVVKFDNPAHPKGVKLNIPNHISKHTEHFDKGITKPPLNKHFLHIVKLNGNLPNFIPKPAFVGLSKPKIHILVRIARIHLPNHSNLKKPKNFFNVAHLLMMKMLNLSHKMKGNIKHNNLVHRGYKVMNSLKNKFNNSKNKKMNNSNKRSVSNTKVSNKNHHLTTAERLKRDKPLVRDLVNIGKKLYPIGARSSSIKKLDSIKNNHRLLNNVITRLEKINKTL